MRARRSKPIVERNKGEKSKRSIAISSNEQHGRQPPEGQSAGYVCTAPQWRPHVLEIGTTGLRSRARILPRSRLLLQAKPLEPLVEARELAACIEQAMLPAGPGRVRFRIDVEAQRVARFAVGRTRLIGAAIGHHDGDLVIVR